MSVRNFKSFLLWQFLLCWLAAGQPPVPSYETVPGQIDSAGARMPEQADSLVIIPGYTDSSYGTEADDNDTSTILIPDTAARGDQDSAFIESLPYVDRSLDSLSAANFKNSFSVAVQFIRTGRDSSALALLSRLSPRERLARIYVQLVTADIYERQKNYRAADSLLRDGLHWIRKKKWRTFCYHRRLLLYPHLKPNREEKLEFFSDQMEAGHGDSLQTGFILEILGLNGFDGSSGELDIYLDELFSLNMHDPRLDSLYRLIAKNSKPGDRPADAELALAKYENAKGKNKIAMKRCRAVEKNTRDRKMLRKIRLFQCDLQYYQGNYKKAIKFYERYLERYGKHAHAFLQIARAYKKMGQRAKSTEWYNRFTEEFPDHRKTEEIFWIRAWDKEQEKNYSEAVIFYEKLIPAFIRKKRGRWARFRMGYSYYKAGQYEKALKPFRESQKQADGRMAVPASLFWEGLTLEKLNRKGQARKKLLKVYSDYPLDFYGHMAKTRLKESGRWKKSYDNRVRIKSRTPEQVMKWVRGLPKSSRNIDCVSSYFDIVDLLTLELDTLALVTLDASYACQKDNPVFLYTYAKHFSKIWEEKSYYLARRLSYKIADAKWKDVPLEVLKLIYPKPFREVVSRYAGKRKLQEDFIFSLMKQESGFIPDIGSFAGAIGLMQIMPATGKGLAKQENLKGFQVMDLRNPEINVRLGTRYLQDLKKEYDDNLVLVLCNYNAGPRPTLRWKKALKGKPMEIFSEEISYWETRDYVKKVMGNFWTYQLLYKGN
ncbi:transglycosylase SLT domain-containing protein [Fibrobacterota bacterium]